MTINHYHLESAIAHLSKQIQLRKPDKHFILFKTMLGVDRLSWRLWADQSYEDLCKEMGVVSFERFPEPEPYIVKLDEIDKEKKTSIKDIFIEVEGLEIALLTAQKFMLSSQKFSNIILFAVLNRCDSTAKIWQLDYMAEHNNQQWHHIQIKVDGGIGVILDVKSNT